MSSSSSSTPASLRQSANRSSSGPVSTAATDPPTRTRTASPCPTSQPKTVQSSGTAAERITGLTEETRRAARHRPTAAAAIALVRGGSLTRPGAPSAGSPGVAARTATTTTALSRAQNTTAVTPCASSSRSIGSAAPARAHRAIHVDGTQASAPIPVAIVGSTGPARQQRRPSTVANGAAGAARMFAGTETRDTAGSRIAMTG
nr:hypothetical protein [Mycetocola reblochoni]